MTEFVDLIDSTRAEMKSWRAEGGKWDQIRADIAAVRKAKDGDWVKVSNPANLVDVTAWGDAERKWYNPYQSIPFARITIHAAKLVRVFDVAYEMGGIIAWVPDGTVIPEAVGEIVTRIQNVWGDQPPYIEVVGEPHRQVYSIKPVWEL